MDLTGSRRKDSHTKVRLEFANRDFNLEPEMYANAEIEVDGGKKLAMPDEAVLDSGIRERSSLSTKAKGGSRRRR